MNEETRLILQAIISILVAVVVAFVTSWLNRKFFRGQLGEQRYFEVYLSKMLDLWEEVADIYKQTEGTCLVIREMQDQGSSQEEMKRVYRERMLPVLPKAVSLERYYLLFRQSTIDALRQFTSTLLDESMKDFEEPLSISILDKLVPLFNKVFEQVRNDLSDLAAWKTSVSEILASPVDITPLHVSEILSKPRENPFGAEGKAGQHL